VLSLECSNTQLSSAIQPPLFVRQSDLFHFVWPQSISTIKPTEPQTSLYCHMNSSNSFINFHHNFSGANIWFHVWSGKQTFIVIQTDAEILKK
jgi:hypothetical protein